MTLKDSKLVHVRVSDQNVEVIDETINSEIRIDLTAGIERRKNHKIHLSLSSATIPFTWHEFSAYLNTNQMEVDSAASLVIPDGNYNIYEMCETITSDATFPYSASFSDITGKVTLTNTDSAQHVINFSSAASKRLARAIGFSPTDVTVASDGTTSSDIAINMQIVHSLFLYSKLGITNVITTNSGNYEQILDQIPLIDATPYSTIHYQPMDTAPFSTNIQQDEIAVFEISIRDQNAQLVQLRDAHYEFSILVEQHEHKELMEGPRHHSGPGQRDLDKRHGDEFAGIAKRHRVDAGPVLHTMGNAHHTPVFTHELYEKPSYEPNMPQPNPLPLPGPIPIESDIPPPSTTPPPPPPPPPTDPPVNDNVNSDLNQAILAAHTLNL